MTRRLLLAALVLVVVLLALGGWTVRGIRRVAGATAAAGPRALRALRAT